MSAKQFLNWYYSQKAAYDLSTAATRINAAITCNCSAALQINWSVRLMRHPGTCAMLTMAVYEDFAEFSEDI